MATELAKAYVQIVPSADGIKGSIAKIIDPEAESAGKSSGTKLMGGLSSVLGGASKIAGAAMAATAAGVTALTKAAVDNYANYEQLVGGVETLFKDSADQVMQYANNAYKTAGLSANDYMETVTGFSASLLQGLGGDTKKAADVANRAVIDMSDNANKMGTSIESIQNAYQGFAKQNYTMLDNLKLGYGGTKSEMERLIQDAAQMTDVQNQLGISVDASSMSFDNIINAISVMQTSLGIAGTTSLEAGETISGSAGAVKAAWDNLVTGIADDNADFSTLISNFVDSASTMLSNLMPRIQSALSGIADLITQLAPVIIAELPKLISTLLPELLNSVTSIASSLSAVLPDVISTIALVIIDNLPTIIDAGIEIILSLVNGIIKSLPKLIPAAVDAVLKICDALIDNVDLLIDGAIALIVGLAEGLINALPKLIEKGPEIVIKLVTAIVSNAPKLAQAAVQLVTSLTNGLINSWSTLISNIPGLISKIVSAIANMASSMRNAGINLVAGLWNGFKENWNNLVNNVKNMANNLISSVKSVFGIHSPSKVFSDIGNYCVIGFDNSFKDFGNEALDQVDSVLSGIEDKTYSMDINAQKLTDSASVYNDPKPSRNNDSAEMLSLLSQYLPELGKTTQTNIALQGDADGIFRVVKNEVDKFTRSTGYNPFAMA